MIPISASALVAARGLTVDTRLGLITTYFLVFKTGRICSSIATRASVTFLRRASPWIRETVERFENAIGGSVAAFVLDGVWAAERVRVAATPALKATPNRVRREKYCNATIPPGIESNFDHYYTRIG